MKIKQVDQNLADRVSIQQENLLMAALLNDTNDIQLKYRLWADSVDWATEFDNGTYQLLPLLFTNLDQAGIEDANMGRLRGLYRRAWYSNQRYMAAWPVMAHHLATASMKTVLLGDLALINSLCLKPGARLLNRLDLLIDPAAMTEVLICLSTLGWTPQPFHHEARKYRCYTTLSNTNGERLRLHWHPLHIQCMDDSYSFTNLGVRPDNNTTKCLVPTPTNLLAHLIVSRFEANNTQLLADIASTYLIVSDGEVDWQDLLRLADAYRFNLRLYSVCAYLRRQLQAPIPEYVVDELADRTVSMPERLEQRIANSSTASLDTLFGSLIRLLAQFTRYTNGSSAAKTMHSLPGFLRHYFRTRSRTQIIAAVLRSGTRQMVGWIKRAPVLRQFAPKNATEPTH